MLYRHRGGECEHICPLTDPGGREFGGPNLINTFLTSSWPSPAEGFGSVQSSRSVSLIDPSGRVRRRQARCSPPPLRRRASPAGTALELDTPQFSPGPTARLSQTKHQPAPAGGERKRAASGRSAPARRCLRAAHGAQRIRTHLAGCIDSTWRACDAPHATAARSSRRMSILPAGLVLSHLPLVVAVKRPFTARVRARDFSASMARPTAGSSRSSRAVYRCSTLGEYNACGPGGDAEHRHHLPVFPAVARPAHRQGHVRSASDGRATLTANEPCCANAPDPPYGSSGRNRRRLSSRARGRYSGGKVAG